MSETPNDAEEELPAALVALISCSDDDERAVLNQILTAGHDQGLILSDCASVVLALTPAEAAALHKQAAERATTKPSVADAWADAVPPARPVPDDGECWAVLTQRCDLVRSFSVEPLVEVARVVRLAPWDGAAARTNSPRLIFLADTTDGSWAVDLRQRAVVPKLALSTVTATPAIADARAQKRFRLRIGQRYWRDPVPDDLVETLQRPLISAVKNSRSRVALFENFTMWLGVRDGAGAVIVIAVALEGRLSQAQEDWDEVVKLLNEKEPTAVALINLDDSGVFTADDVPLSLWLDSFKFDFDEITYGRRAAASSAEPQV